MSAFSFTAPGISKEQEEKELASMTDEEKTRVDNDLYGRDNSDDDHPKSVRSHTDMTRKAVASLPDSERMAYDEAMEKCPQLVEIESDPLRFLRVEAFDPEMAAKRLASYWKIRKNIFGEKAFRPMRLDDENGALTLKDIQYMEGSGASSMYLLPDDSLDRSVIFVDRTKLSSSGVANIGKENMIRVFWYFVHVALQERERKHAEAVKLAEDPTTHAIPSPVGRFVIVSNSRLSTVQQFDRMYAKMQYDSLRKALPIKVCAIHSCDASSVMRTFVLPSLKFIMGRDLRLRFRVHEECSVSDTSDEALSSWPLCLEEYGLNRESIPTVLGGTYQHDGKSWCHQQRVKEKQPGEMDSDEYWAV